MKTVQLLRLERRRNLTQALRDCTPLERKFLRALPAHGHAPYATGKTLGISSRTVHTFVHRERVKRARQLFVEESLEDIQVTHTSLVADLVAIKNHCMAAMLKDYKAAVPALAAIRDLADLLKLSPPKRLEATGADGVPLIPPSSAQLTREVAEVIAKTEDPTDAALAYQRLMYGERTSKAVN